VLKGVTVKKQETERMIARQSHNGERGFSMVELAVVTIIICTIAAIAVVKLQPALQQSQAAAGKDQVKSALRQARETAISQRRTIVVKFVATANGTPCPIAPGIFNCVELFQVAVSGTPPVAVVAANPFLTLPIENNVQFMTLVGETDLPAPDGVGLPTAPAGTSFPGAVGNMQFQSDGSFTDSNGTPRSGTIFLAVSGMSSTESAVAVMGNTGRIRSYHGNGSSPTGWVLQ
jgi:prepilin-type N-terminal cleavage/methylation domain-containing protein